MRTQTLVEERWNALTHGVAALMGTIGMVMMLVKLDVNQDWGLFSVVVYGLYLSWQCQHFFIVSFMSNCFLN